MTLLVNCFMKFLFKFRGWGEAGKAAAAFCLPFFAE